MQTENKKSTIFNFQNPNSSINLNSDNNLGSQTNFYDEKKETLEKFVQKKALKLYLKGEITFKEYLSAKNFPKNFAKKNNWLNTPNKSGKWDKRQNKILEEKSRFKLMKLKDVVKDNIHKKKTLKESIFKKSDLYSFSNEQTQLFKNYYQICNDFELRIKNKDLINEDPSEKYYEKFPKKKIYLSNYTIICHKNRGNQTERSSDFLNSEVFEELNRKSQIKKKKTFHENNLKTSPRSNLIKGKMSFSQAFSERNQDRKISMCKEYLSRRSFSTFQESLKKKAEQLEKDLKAMGYRAVPQIKDVQYHSITHNKTENESKEYSDDSDLPSVTEHVLEDYYSKSSSLQKLFQDGNQGSIIKRLQQVLRLNEIQK